MLLFAAVRLAPQLCVVLALISACGGTTPQNPTPEAVERRTRPIPDRPSERVDRPEPQPANRCVGISDTPAQSLQADDVTRRKVQSWEMPDLFPHRTWPQQLGQVRGILMSAGEQPWGGSMMWSGTIDLSAQRTEYRYYGSQTSAYAVYFLSEDGRGFNPIQGWQLTDQDGTQSQPKVAMFHFDTPNEWGLCRRAHLVEAKALSADGVNPLHFVIAHTNRIDGTQRFPLLLEPLLVTLRARFDNELKLARPKLEAIVKTQRAGVPSDWVWMDREGTKVGALPSWNDKTQTLDVTYYARRLGVAEGPREQQQSPCPVCRCDPKGNCPPCIPCDRRRHWKKPQKMIGWQTAVRYRIEGGSGRLVEELLYLPKPT